MTLQEAIKTAADHHQSGRFDQAIAAYREVIAIYPSLAEIHCNLGAALSDAGRLDEAIAAYRKAIALKPQIAEIHYNMGVALADKGMLPEAIAAYRQAIVLRPEFPQALNNLGNALRDNGQLDDAIAAFEKVVAILPANADSLFNLANAYRDQGRLDEAIAAFRQALALAPDRTDIDSSFILTLHYHPAFDAQAIAQEHRRWDRQHAQPLHRFIPLHLNDRDPDRRVKIGYVSPDFRQHCQALFTVPVLSRHDHQNFQIVCYSGVQCPDAMTHRLRGYADVWREAAALSDEQLAGLIHEDRIDVLVDLTMHMAGNRLPVFARKPAPVQVCWLAYPASTGLSAMDYRLSDPYLDPPGEEESIYTERTIRMPDTFWCYDPLSSEPVGELPAERHGCITFGCLNAVCKINESQLAVWTKVMRRVQNSRLILLSPAGSARQRMIERFDQEGVDPIRIEFVPYQPRQRYLQVYHRIDLGLDSFPINGHTTSLDSFWMGVPVVTLIGPTPISRAGWCQLSNLGLSELAAHTPEQFVRIAVDLAGDLSRLKELRSTLRRRMEQSCLMDADRFTRNIEAAYRQMWRSWCTSPNAQSHQPR